MEEHIQFKCDNCGSTEFEFVGNDCVKCKYCNAVYKKNPNGQSGNKSACIELGETGKKIYYKVKSNKKVVYGVIALIFGWCGFQYLLLGKFGKFALSFLFFWTAIPYIISVIDGVKALCMSNENFEKILDENPNCALKQL